MFAVVLHDFKNDPDVSAIELVGPFADEQSANDYARAFVMESGRSDYTQAIVVPVLPPDSRIDPTLR